MLTVCHNPLAVDAEACLLHGSQHTGKRHFDPLHQIALTALLQLLGDEGVKTQIVGHGRYGLAEQFPEIVRNQCGEIKIVF